MGTYRSVRPPVGGYWPDQGPRASDGQPPARASRPYATTDVPAPARRPPHTAPRPCEASARIPEQRRQATPRVDTTSVVDRSPPPEAAGSGGYLAAVISTLAWYAIPASIYVFLLLTRENEPPPGCTGVDGLVCRSARATAFAAAVDALPWVLATAGIGAFTALVLRWFNTGWRSMGAGFAAAAVGGGLVTLLHAVMSTQG